MTELELVAGQLESATSYLDVFGACDGQACAQTEHVKSVYRQLLKTTHPDKYMAAADKQLATRAFQQLSRWYELANAAIKSGRYGEQHALAEVRTRKGTHRISKHRASGDIADVYNGMFEQTPAVYKIAHSAADNDLLQNEAQVLRKLRASGTDKAYHAYVPELLDSFGFKDGAVRVCNATLEVANLWPLTAVRQQYPHGVHSLDMGWIWRRLLVAIGYAHNNGVIHGAITPDHVLIEPDQHGLVLVDWCYASSQDAQGDFAPIVAISPAYRDWCPKEVIAKEAPSPATDIVMAARTMVYLLGGDAVGGTMPDTVPPQLRAFLRSCLHANQLSRPQNAWELLIEFDELLERLGGPYWPRRFRPFRMTT